MRALHVCSARNKLSDGQTGKVTVKTRRGRTTYGPSSFAKRENEKPCPTTVAFGITSRPRVGNGGRESCFVGVESNKVEESGNTVAFESERASERAVLTSGPYSFALTRSILSLSLSLISVREYKRRATLGISRFSDTLRAADVYEGTRGDVARAIYVPPSSFSSFSLVEPIPVSRRGGWLLPLSLSLFRNPFSSETSSTYPRCTVHWLRADFKLRVIDAYPL